ncbi:unnamed protein product [Ceutorhynchus assimilis]|uniref:Peptidase S1 domain-containing protein n=1 Tax=Ceutorhynchus assimilis TaxID=467358 RepID=A0A9N9QA32_9CUCU|nr:unnamed protein product [Ceutorhynchus assimilis]
MKVLILFLVAKTCFCLEVVNNVNSIIEKQNDCACVFYYQCDKEGFIITNGIGLVEPRFSTSSKSDQAITCSGSRFENEIICCKFKPEEAVKLPTTNNTKKIKLLQCGKPRPTINIRISAADENEFPLDGEFPWIAAIYKKHSNNHWKYHKIGSLIHPRVVLTGAHVVASSKPKDLKVIVNGKIELQQIGFNTIQERNLTRIIKHPKFSSGTLYNDVALLILEKEYGSMTPLINTICLNPDISFENKRCLVAGWGKISQTSSKISNVLRKVELPTHSPEKCQEMLRKTRLGPRYHFHESFMCAGGEEGKDSCKGDGGGALVCPTGINDTMYQVGIVAFGINCGQKNVPGVYANVGKFYVWIVETLKPFEISL